MLRLLKGFALGLAVCLSAAWADDAQEARLREAEAAYRLGDFNEAFRLMQALAEEGHGVAMHSFAELFDDGLGVKQDYQEALRW